MEKIDMIQTADGQQFNFGATGGGVKNIRLEYSYEEAVAEVIKEISYDELGITYEDMIDYVSFNSDIAFDYIYTASITETMQIQVKVSGMDAIYALLDYTEGDKNILSQMSQFFDLVSDANYIICNTSNAHTAMLAIYEDKIKYAIDFFRLNYEKN